MAQTLLYGFVLFTAAFAEKTKEDTPNVFNLEVAMKKFVGIFEKVYKVKVKWTDMNSEREEVKNLFATKKFFLSVDMDHIKMGKPIPRDTIRTLLYANLYENKANKNQTYTVTHTTVRKEKTSATVKQGFSLGLEVSGGVGWKEKFGLSATVGTKFERETASTDTTTKLKTFAVATGVNVPPNRTVEVLWFANTATTDIPWTCDVTISGYFVMGIEPALQGTQVLVIPANYLALANKELEVVGPRRVRFQMSGVFTKITVPESDIYTNDVTDTLEGKIMETF
uniref:Putative cytotoxin-like protein n=1 Tax=Ixodes ricinus TaxID=34613 RepID=A0A0K8RK67_IXORI